MFRPPTDGLICSSCEQQMHLTAVIPPVGGGYGLVVYVCPRCERSRDLLMPAFHGHARS